MKNKIKVVDSCMGQGKTSWAIQHMNETSGPWLYITPYLDELDRIAGGKKNGKVIEPACPGFHKPKDSSGKGNKSDDLKRLLADGCNIAATHQLFKRLDAEALDLIEGSGYRLIMDEVMQVLEVVSWGQEKVQALFTREVLAKGETTENGAIAKVTPGPEVRLDEFKQLQTWASEERLVLVSNTLLMWMFPAGVFGSFREVFNLCYLFDGQYQKGYYDLHGLEYQMMTVEKEQQSQTASSAGLPDAGGRYRLTPRVSEQVDPQWEELIDIYEGPLCQIGEEWHSMSHTWFGKKGAPLRKLGGHLFNYFRHMKKAKAQDILWTVPKAQQRVVGKKGFATGFLSRTTRATNDYRERSVLAHCVNIFMKPEIVQFFRGLGIELDQERYALSELLQWVWRSQVRERLPISLYLPSVRMRTILKSWLRSWRVEGLAEVETYEEEVKAA
jgi:hypothetical protein